MIHVDELKTAIKKRITDYLTSSLALKRPIVKVSLTAAQNSILARDIEAEFDIPRQNLSAMDGFALAKGSNIGQNDEIQIIGESCAGKPYIGKLLPNQGVRIFTGAIVPNDCDTVVMQENTNFASIQNDLNKSNPYQISLTQVTVIGMNIRRQGEEITTGEKVLNVGKRLNPADISLLANLGIAQVEVFEPIIIGIIATGDELVEIGQPFESIAQIYNSNTPTLKTLFSELPIIIKDYGIIPDNLDITRQVIEKAIQQCDTIITSAGVSVGDYDYLTSVIHEFGKINQYKVAMKPGKPFVFGEFQRDEKTVFYFGLPGNPLSTIVCSLKFVKPALWQLSGVQENEIPKQFKLNAITTQEIKKTVGRQDYQRAIFCQNTDGNFVVTPLLAQDSHRVKQLSQSNCLIVLPQENSGVKAGENVIIEPFSWNFQ